MAHAPPARCARARCRFTNVKILHADISPKNIIREHLDRMGKWTEFSGKRPNGTNRTEWPGLRRKKWRPGALQGCRGRDFFCCRDCPTFPLLSRGHRFAGPKTKFDRILFFRPLVASEGPKIEGAPDLPPKTTPVSKSKYFKSGGLKKWVPYFGPKL